MTARRKKIISQATLALAVVLAAWFVFTAREPEHEGKKLSYWIEAVDAWDADQDQARAAILAMGTNSLPFLWREVNAEDSPARSRLIAWLARQPIRALRITPANARLHRAYSAMGILGTNIAPLAPSFIPWLHDRAEDAADFFYFMGPAALPTLHQALRNADPSIRFHAAMIISGIDTNTTVHLPAVADALRQTGDKTLRSEALRFLYFASARGHEPLLHAYLLCLQDPDDAIRTAATYGLSLLDGHDRTALPYLQATAAQTADPALARTAKFALEYFNAAIKRAEADDATP